MKKSHSKLAEMFHTFHTSLKRYGRLEANNGAVFPYLHTFHTVFLTHTCVRTHPRTRTRAHTHTHTTFLVWKVWKVWKRQYLSAFEGSIPQQLGMEGYGT
jgi:hypothetical protein